jgi:exo-beta-1,3-glucanase (GH17 family)
VYSNPVLAGQIASRYGPEGAKPCCDVFEIGNEPYWDGSNVASYAQSALATIREIKRVSPGSRTSLALGPTLSWIDQLEAAAPGVLAAPDFFAHHPYSNRSTKYGDPSVWDPNAFDWGLSWQRTIKLRERVMALGHSQPFLLTETGWHTKHDYGNGVVWTEAQQANFITKAYSIARNWGWVAGMYVFALDDNPNCASTDPENFYGLRRCDKTQKPAYTTFKGA